MANFIEEAVPLLMLITAFGLSIFGPKVAPRVGSPHVTECPVGFDQNGITDLTTHPKLQKILSLH